VGTEAELRGRLLVRSRWGQGVEIVDEEKRPLYTVRVFLRRPGQAFGCGLFAAVAAVLALGRSLHGRVGVGAVILSCLGAFVLVLLAVLLPAVVRRSRLCFLRADGSGPLLTIEEQPTPFTLGLDEEAARKRYRLFDGSGDTLAWLPGLGAACATDGEGNVLVSLHREVEPPLPAEFVQRHGLADDRLHQGYLELYDGSGQKLGSMRRASPLLDAALLDFGEAEGQDRTVALAVAVFHEVTALTMADLELARARGVPTYVPSSRRR